MTECLFRVSREWGGGFEPLWARREVFSPRTGGFPRALGNGCVLEGGEWEAQGLNKTRSEAQAGLGSVRGLGQGLRWD